MLEHSLHKPVAFIIMPIFALANTGIFIANLAFTGNAVAINASKTAILAASLMAGIVGFLWLQSLAKPPATDGHH